MNIPLLQTKLYPPPPGPGVIPRARLQSRLAAAIKPSHRLTLVAAPAGYGKTTLVSAWLAAQELPAAWLSLDVEDNDAIRFLRYVVAALRMARPGVGAAAEEMLGAPEPPPLDSVLTLLINDLVPSDPTAPGPCVLVLDDYHVIQAPAIHDAVTFLIDHLPPDLRLVITSRVDPPLPIHRWRARQQMVELRAGDLRLTSDEVAAVLHRSDLHVLTESDLNALTTRTEGWPVGIQLAAQALRAAETPEEAAEFVHQFSGSHRYILDYLLEEVVSQQPEPVRRFLMETSILDRLSVSLCDALVEPRSPEEPRPNGAAGILRYLSRADLFIIPLDATGEWYRYHHLFAELLRLRLHELMPERVKPLHRQAAGWFEDHGQPAAAVRHALAAEDFVRAAELVAAHTRDFLAGGRLGDLLIWLRQLPEELSRRRPWLCVQRAWTLIFAGKPTPLALWLDAAEAHEVATAVDLTPAERRRLRGHIHAIRAFAAAIGGEGEAALERAGIADRALPEDEPWVRSVLAWVWGHVYRKRGELAKAEAAFHDLEAYGRAADNIWTRITGYTELILIYRLQGRLEEALDLGRETLTLAEASGARHYGYVGRLESVLGALYLQQNQPAAAAQHAEAGLALSELWRNPNHLLYGQIVLARVRFAQGDLTGVASALEAAEPFRTQPVIPILPVSLDAAWVDLWLSTGQVAKAKRWAGAAAEALTVTTAELTEPDARCRLTLARVHLAHDTADAARTVLMPVIESGPPRYRMEALALQALAQDAGDDLNGAISTLSQAVELAAPGNHRRIFLDEGPKMARLLRRAQSRPVDPAVTRHVNALLADFGDRATAPDTEPAAALIEPLTDRELDVLALMAEGRTNREIAEALVIATGTVKAHTAAIYQKLDVHNRTEAAARARALGLV